MAPLAQPLTNPNANNVLASLRRRGYECSQYDTSCDTHGVVVKVAIVCVVVMVSGIVSALFIRARRRHLAKLRNTSQHQHQYQLHLNKSLQQSSGATLNPQLDGSYDAPPPPYVPRRPDTVARAGRDWR
ncbi:hypothetical protein GQ44DRAFT_712272 [Phaeosphaeriaceae sp. PMI808]|nr:hypothetical protein GQ44DRAFT_712272 [Phaeosphaeriaceae sp. PMI808]